MKKLIFNSLTASILLLTSCSKDDFTIDLGGGWGGWSIPTFNGSSFDTTAIAYIRLPLNRHYIYRDPSTGATDSVVVTQSLDSISFQSPSPGYNFTYVLTTFKLTLSGFTGSPSPVFYNAECTSDFPPGVGSAASPVSIIDSNFILSGGPGSLPAFWYPFNSSGLNQYSYTASMTVEGITYTGVHVFNTTNGLPPTNPNYASAEFCWVKGIGIIKKEIKTYNTVKTSLLVRFG